MFFEIYEDQVRDQQQQRKKLHKLWNIPQIQVINNSVR